MVVCFFEIDAVSAVLVCLFFLGEGSGTVVQRPRLARKYLDALF